MKSVTRANKVSITKQKQKQDEILSASGSLSCATQQQYILTFRDDSSLISAVLSCAGQTSSAEVWSPDASHVKGHSEAYYHCLSSAHGLCQSNPVKYWSHILI